MATNNMVSHPDHYQYDGMQCKDVMKALGISKAYWQASALKYLMRAGRKGDIEKYVEDLQKAKQSIDFLIEELEEEWKEKLIKEQT